jgi:hypothetical protein
MLIAGDVLQRAREFLYLDTDTDNLRISDEEGLVWLTLAQKEIARRKPDSMYRDDEIVTDPPAIVSSKTQSLEVLDQYENALINFLLHKFFAKDTEDANNRARMKDFYNMFISDLGV